VEIDYYTKGKGNAQFKAGRKGPTKKGCRVRGIPDEADLELLRAAKKQRLEERKLEIIQERQEKAYNAELKRLEQATARKTCRCTKETSKGVWTFYPRPGKKSSAKCPEQGER
jgi:hypothetical protein